MRSPDELVSAFRERGLKMTPQRQLIFRLLEGNTSHPSAEALYALAAAQMPGISLRTVYQTLNDLSSMGELNLLDLGTGAARFDPNVGDHQHLVCTECGAIHDVHVAGVGHLRPQGGPSGFMVGDTEVVFRGKCSECVTAAERSPVQSSNQQGVPT